MNAANGFGVFKQQMQSVNQGKFKNYVMSQDNETTSKDDSESFMPESAITHSEDFGKTDMTNFMNNTGGGRGMVKV